MDNGQEPVAELKIERKNSGAKATGTEELEVVWQPADAHYATRTKLRFKHKLFKMDRDLVKDSKSKVAAISYMKKKYENSEAYQLGEMTYEIRRKFVRMMFVYFRTLENYDAYSHNKHFLNLMEIQHLHMNIDNMIQMIEENDDRHTRKKRITRTGKQVFLKTGNHKEDEKLEAEIEWQKQKAYAERKKLEWSLAHGIPRSNLHKNNFKKKDVVEEGFDSDVVN